MHRACRLSAQIRPEAPDHTQPGLRALEGGNERDQAGVRDAEHMRVELQVGFTEAEEEAVGGGSEPGGC